MLDPNLRVNNSSTDSSSTIRDGVFKSLIIADGIERRLSCFIIEGINPIKEDGNLIK